MISPTARANCPACRGLFPGVFGGGPDVSKKPNKINTQSEHNTELSDVKSQIGTKNVQLARAEPSFKSSGPVVIC